MSDVDTYRQILSLLIKKQMMLLGKKESLEKVKKIDGLKVDENGDVLEIGGNLNATLESALTVYSNFPSKIAALEVIQAKSEQEKVVRQQIASGWLQIELEKEQLTSALNSLALGFISTNDALQVQFQNTAAASLLGMGPGKAWSLSDLQNNISGETYLPLECKKCMETLVPLPPFEIVYRNRPLKVFVSPIKIFTKEVEVTGVVLIFEDLTPLPASAI